MSSKTKAALYRALILTVMLYNAEVWSIKAQDMKALEGTHFTMMRRLMTNEKNEHIKRDSLLSKLKLPSIADYITHKRLSWIGHALRRSDKDRSRRAVIAALENKKAKWAQLVAKDCAKVKVNYDRLPKLVLDKNKFREHFSRLPTYSGQAGNHRPPASKKHEQMRTKLSQTTRSASRRSNLVEMG